MIKLKKSFTLIELLVVIFIIGILASIIVVSLSSVRAKGRDARRKSDIDQIQKALSLYYNENGSYPGSGSDVSTTCSNTGWNCSQNSASWDASGGLQGALSPYISLPIDPINTSGTNSWAAYGANRYNYNYYSSGYGCEQQWYMLVYRLESPGSTVSPGAHSCTTDFNYSITRPGTITVGSCESKDCQ
ncbi:MAG: prepilin-type N-terminal cleavage/methylation domain-containing protein [bacterium]